MILDLRGKCDIFLEIKDKNFYFSTILEEVKWKRKGRMEGPTFYIIMKNEKLCSELNDFHTFI